MQLKHIYNMQWSDYCYSHKMMNKTKPSLSFIFYSPFFLQNEITYLSRSYLKNHNIFYFNIDKNKVPYIIVYNVAIYYKKTSPYS